MYITRERRPVAGGGDPRVCQNGGSSSDGQAYTARERSLQERRTAELRRLRRQRYAQRIWRLGERVAFELVEHLIAAFDLDEDAVDNVLGHFAEINPNVLRALGADRLPPAPIHAVRGAR
jgi:hypothetical protein